jgi:tetratricopeptide (TPR) repeat protein
MVAIAPDNMKWRMEVQYADADLGVALYEQRKFAQAVAQFEEALKTIEAISTADPSNNDYRQELAESLAWLADAQMAVGNFAAAIAARQRDIQLLDGMLARTGDVDYRQRLVPARRVLGNLYAETGQSALALEQYRIAMAHAKALHSVEPDNTQWVEYGVWAQFGLAKELMATGQQAEAAAAAEQACQTTRILLKRDSNNPNWRKALSTCFLLEGQLALKEGSKAQARDLAERSVTAARSVHTSDAVDDRFARAKAYLALGDAERALGDATAAQAAWGQALAGISGNFTERSDETALRADLLERLGRAAEAAPLRARLNRVGYKGD